MTKAAMISKIIDEAKAAAIIDKRHCDVADIFFSLAFMSDEGLRAICKKLGRS